MGVHSLWDIVGPAARPVKLEALSRKKLAVDASIWIYQFLKAVRDKEGNALGQSHIVGFFRRLCKMLYFGILPLFVFDGGAPALKRQVIQKRRERRSGNADSVSSTAQKLLLMQMNKRKAGSKNREIKSTESTGNTATNTGTDPTGTAGTNRGTDHNTRTTGTNIGYSGSTGAGVYFEDLPSNDLGQGQDQDQNRTQTQLFRPKDEYHLPEIKQFRVRKSDERILPPEEVEDTENHDFDVVDGVHIDSVDPSSAEFAQLPMATQYMILNHLRLRSRLRMGYTKDQLVGLFPNSKDFSRFQIQQVQKRNFYTQKLMNVSGMSEDSGNVSKRIAGDKDRQYMLVKNEGGWTLSLGEANHTDQDNDESGSGQIVDLDEEDLIGHGRESGKETNGQRKTVKAESIASDSDIEDLEDVPLEAESDDEKNRILIESLYERYPETNQGKVLEDQQAFLAVNGEDSQPAAVNGGIPLESGSVSGFSEWELREAVEQSKKDFYKERKQEEAFDLQNSLLFSAENTEQGNEEDKGDRNESEHPEVKWDKGQAERSIEEATAEMDKEENKEDNEKEMRKETPSWFSAPQTFGQESIGVFNEDNTQKRLNEDEEAGLISWTEAKDYYKQATEAPEWIEIEDEADVPKEEVEEVKEVSESEARAHTVLENGHSQLGDAGQDTEQAVSEGDSGVNRATKNRASKAKGKKNEKESKTEKETDKESKTEKETDKESKTDSEDKEKKEETETGESHFERDDSKTREDSKTKQDSKTEEEPNIKESMTEDLKEDLAKDFGKTGESVEKVDSKMLMDYDFSEDEESNLQQQLHEEEDDYHDFSRRIQVDNLNIHTQVGAEQLLQEQLQKAKRDADEVTQTMVNDVQELLRRFGIPYITAPMEAEAQCAKLYQLGLVDGIVTDDSDCFLFGGSRVYKNMFNQKQYVECYIGEDIEHKIGLSQDKLIDLALLLGSDYTEGIKGIGPVLAMEILAEFGDLHTFKAWFLDRKKELSMGETSSTTDGDKQKGNKGKEGERTKLEKNLISRIKSGKLFLNDDFPSETVRTAYKHPDVDPDSSHFKWGIPSLDQIRSFLMYNVGWTQARVDEVMVPLVRNMNKARTSGVQSTVSEFFPQEYISYRKDLSMGKRMKLAAERMRKEA